MPFAPTGDPTTRLRALECWLPTIQALNLEEGWDCDAPTLQALLLLALPSLLQACSVADARAILRAMHQLHASVSR